MPDLKFSFVHSLFSVIREVDGSHSLSVAYWALDRTKTAQPFLRTPHLKSSMPAEQPAERRRVAAMTGQGCRATHLPHLKGLQSLLLFQPSPEEEPLQLAPCRGV